MDMTVPLKDAEDDRFTECSASSFSFDAPCTKERFVNFNLSKKWRLSIAIFDESLPDRLQISVDSVAIQAGQFSDLGSF